MAQFIDETGGELEEMNLQSSYEKHMPSVVFWELGRKKPKSHF